MCDRSARSIYAVRPLQRSGFVGGQADPMSALNTGMWRPRTLEQCFAAKCDNCLLRRGTSLKARVEFEVMRASVR